MRRRAPHKQRATKRPSAEVRTPPRRRFRKWLLRLIALTVIPATFWAVLECGLRMLGYGHPTGFTIVQEVNERECYVPNPAFGWRFFPRAVSRTSKPFAYPVEKGDETVRIFVLGASAAQGDPEPAYGLSRVLKVMLADRYPSTRIEVINVAMVAINSHTVREIAEEVAQHDADLLVVYLGNNEVVGPFGAGNPLVPMLHSRALIRTKLTIGRFRLGQLIANNAARSNDPDSNRIWRGMEEFLEHQVPADAPALDQVYKNFRANLDDICSNAGVPIVLSTVAVNLRDCPPFASQHRPDLNNADRARWEQHVERGAKLVYDDTLDLAATAFQEALAIDDSHAELHYRIAQCRSRQGQPDEARTHYIQARELDILRFRADSSINAVIREVGANGSTGVRLLDAEALFTKASPDGIPGKELFLDHVHMNFHGNVLLGEGLIELVEPQLPDWTRAKRRSGPPLTEERCAEILALTSFDRYQIAQGVLMKRTRPPFVNQLDARERLDRQRDRVQSLREEAMRPASLEVIRRLYEQAIELFPDDWYFRARFGRFLFDGVKDAPGAEAEFRHALALGLDAAIVYQNLGVALLHQGKTSEAITALEAARSRETRSVGILNALGAAHSDDGQWDKAIGFLEQALAIAPNNANVHDNLALALARKGNLDAAVEHGKRAVALNPTHADAHRNLAEVLSRQGKEGIAVDHYRRVLTMIPNDTKALNNLAWILATTPEVKLRNAKEAVLLAERACAMTRFGNPVTLDTLAAAYAEAGRLEDAMATAEKAIALATATGENGEALAETIRSHLAHYRTGRPWRQQIIPPRK